MITPPLGTSGPLPDACIQARIRLLPLVVQIDVEVDEVVTRCNVPDDRAVVVVFRRKRRDPFLGQDSRQPGGVLDLAPALLEGPQFDAVAPDRRAPGAGDV